MSWRRATMPEVSVDFETAYTQHHDCVWRTLRALGVPLLAVDDAVQEVFLVAHRRWADYDGRATVRAWLLGIARKVGPRERTRVARGLDAAPPLTMDRLLAPDDLDLDLDRTLAAQRVARFLEQLDVNQRLVFVLAELEGLTTPEIAAVVGASVNTIYSRLRLARSRFSRMSARARASEERSRVQSR